MKKFFFKFTLWIILILSAFLLQNNLCRMIPFFQTAPNLLLIVTFSLGFLRGKVTGMMTGLVCGLLLDAFSGGILGANVLAFIYIGYLNGLLSRILVNDMILLPLCLSVINEICYSLYSYVVRVLLIGKTNVWDYVKTIMLPELILTVFCTVILYGIIMTVNRRLGAKEKEGENRIA
ncbi:MAG: rod shape-determining protein MreD [Lachnospiraceae bacterium]|nr:rod shape-determining protein MreD [Lachnospiraceae bacterium]